MSDSSLVKTILDAATLTGIVAGIGWATKKVVKIVPRFYHYVERFYK